MGGGEGGGVGDDGRRPAESPRSDAALDPSLLQIVLALEALGVEMYRPPAAGPHDSGVPRAISLMQEPCNTPQRAL